MERLTRTCWTAWGVCRCWSESSFALPSVNIVAAASRMTVAWPQPDFCGRGGQGSYCVHNSFPNHSGKCTQQALAEFFLLHSVPWNGAYTIFLAKLYEKLLLAFGREKERVCELAGIQSILLSVWESKMESWHTCLVVVPVWPYPCSVCTSVPWYSLGFQSGLIHGFKMGE